MNGGRSPAPPSEHTQDRPLRTEETDTHVSEATVRPSENRSDGEAVERDERDVEDGSTTEKPVVSDTGKATDHTTALANHDDAASEAETLIDSPVKKREAEKQNATVKTEKPVKSRIGSLPVHAEDDEESESVTTPLQSTEMSNSKASRGAKDTAADEMDMASDGDDNSSGPLSSPGSPVTDGISLASGQSRALSEKPDYDHDGADDHNPRKRKHRASSVSLPNKRQSVEVPKRRLRGMQSEDTQAGPERSISPKLRSHRRAVSTQSTITDANADGNGRKRRAVTQFPVRDSKSKGAWEESDASSETTGHGQMDGKRLQRGVGRSTSTPGRPVGREHKRHVNKYGFTKLAEACEDGDLDAVKEWLEKDPEQLELAEFAGNKPLQIAALNGNVEVVEYLIEQGCQIDCANVDKDTPLIDAAENGHLEVVKRLLEAGVDPLRQNLKGQQALDVVTDETEDGAEIKAALRRAIESWNSDDAKKKREDEEEQRYKAGPSKELHFMARTYENLLRLVTINDRNGVREFLDARVPVDNNIIAAAAKTGDQYLVNMLLAEMTEKKSYQKAERPMLAVLGTSHFEMVQMLTELDQFNPLWTNRAGKTWPELAEERNGPNKAREKELLQRLYDSHVRATGRRSSSPVTKRDHGKRRLKHAESDEEGDGGEEMPKRKNGRRLMSRRDMRRTHSDVDSDEEEDTSDSGIVTRDADRQHAMRPPESPGHRKAVDRPRRKSTSSQPNDLSPRTRRRSSSLRGPQDAALPTVSEKVENHEQVRLVKAGPDGQSKKAEAKRREEQEAEAKRRAEQEAEAEAEAKRLKDEAKQAEEGRKAEQRRQEEDAERKRAEEAERLRVAEEERKVEEERKAEEERQRQRIEAEREDARRKYRQDVLAALPEEMAKVMDVTSAFRFGDEDARAHIMRLCGPIYAIAETSTKSTAEDLWVLNVQAALLLGKRGIELLLRRDDLGFEHSFTQDWPVRSDFSKQEQRDAERVINRLVLTSQLLREELQPSDDEDDEMSDNARFRAECQAKANRLQTAARMERKLLDGTVKLEAVRLSDVLAHLDPRVKDCTFTVRVLTLTPRPAPPGPGAFAAWAAMPSSMRIFRHGTEVGQATANVGKTHVHVAHEK